MKIFIAGAVTGVSGEDYKIFETYKNSVREIFPSAEIKTPDDIFEFKNNYKKSNPEKSELEILQAMVAFDLSEVASSDIVVADVSKKSTGIGMELASIKNGRVFLFAKLGSEVSDMARGLFGKEIVFYKDAVELNVLLNNEINRTKRLSKN